MVTRFTIEKQHFTKDKMSYAKYVYQRNVLTRNKGSHDCHGRNANFKVKRNIKFIMKVMIACNDHLQLTVVVVFL